MAEVVSGLTGTLQGTLGGMGNKVQAWIDSIFPPEKRNELFARIAKFANERPMLASFIASHIALTGFPLGLFIVMTISVVIFAILAGLIIGLVGAVLFIVTCVGFALIILLPTLFMTTAIATFIWLWGMGTYYILKRFNQKDIPGIHTPFKEGMSNELKGQLGSITGEGGPQGDPSGEHKEEDDGEHKGHANGKPKEGKKENKNLNGVADKVNSAGKSTGVDVGNPKEAADVGKHAGKVTNSASGATNAVGGAKGAVSGTVGV